MFEDFQTKIKAIADNIPEQYKTTIGGNMHWIISQTFIQYFNPRLKELEDRIKELENGNEEGGLQESQGHQEIPTKTARRRKE